MRKMNRNLIILTLLFSPFIAGAQVHIGATTGVNSTFVLDKGLSEDPRFNSKMTYNFAPIGFSFGVDISNGFGLQMESILAKQGQIFEIIDIAKTVVGERKIDLNYIQLPLLFKFMSAKATKARTNFSLGPQLSILRNGVETIQYDASTQDITDVSQLPVGATPNPSGGYDVPALPTTELLSSSANEEIKKFNNTELQIAATFGVDIDISKHLYLSTLIRANYSFTDMRNGDLVDLIKNNNLDGLIDRRANLAIGAQIGLNFMFNGVRSFRLNQLDRNAEAFLYDR
ncbi:porin family protein [Fulvivirgaceae bacterium BMA12]|uniref:Porin family protein n=1 Tax=Agaribacillus aureus TaxID=3051825 RepID=A0ABT8L1D7_9BACT|nr:porin family protein [Fulvivirgaceae bacterium BMA12]